MIGVKSSRDGRAGIQNGFVFLFILAYKGCHILLLSKEQIILFDHGERKEVHYYVTLGF